MQRKKLYVLLATAGTLILIVCGIALALPQPAKAQCGSQASSCKNCHEVQAKDPVNADGTSWHQAHAFGDFCYICHGGNSQATDETAAHTGMAAPLSDVQAACASCHASDLQARADVYAKVLNVSVGMGGGTQGMPAAPQAAAPAAVAAPATGATPAAAVAVEPAALAAGSGAMVDYVKRYDQEVQGKGSTNVGNIILWVMIVAMVIGGGALVLTRERLVRVSFKDTRPVSGEYPADVVDMVPDIAKLTPSARSSLQHMLKKPKAAADLLDAVDKLNEGDKE